MAQRPPLQTKQSTGPRPPSPAGGMSSRSAGSASVGDRRAQRRARLSQAATERSAPDRTATGYLDHQPVRHTGGHLGRPSESRAHRSSRTGGRRKPSSARAAASLRKISSADLSQRRQTLRRKRKFNLLKGGWRLLAVGGAAAGLGWVMMQPLWVLKSPDQIRIKGIQTLSEESIKALLPLEYPQSLLKVKPIELETVLLENAPLRSANVNRQLLPPGLQVQIQERQPVAVAELAVTKDSEDQSSSNVSSASSASSAPNLSSEKAELAGTERGANDASTSAENAPPSDAAPESAGAETEAAGLSKKTKRGLQVLLDEAGDWVPLDRYTGRGQDFDLPKLRVLGMREEYREPWSNLYLSLSESPVEVLEIDWRDPSNLKLQTELGEAHLGPYSSHFAQQLQVLDRMRDLPAHQQAQQVEFIDLRSPLLPRLRMKSQIANQADS